MANSTKIVSVQVAGRWHFATLRLNGTLNKSLRSWDSERAALLAGRREHKVSK